MRPLRDSSAASRQAAEDLEAGVPGARFVRAGVGQRAPATRTVTAWGYALLGATVGIVYVYTAATKWDPEWWAGGVMGRLGRRSFGPMAAGLADAGVPPEMLWVIQGIGVFALECLVAVGYVLAVRLDSTRSRSIRAVVWLALFAAVSFHVSAEVVLNLRIGWFSYYMIALACVFFLPASVLCGLGALVYRPGARLATRGQDLVDLYWTAARGGYAACRRGSGWNRRRHRSIARSPRGATRRVSAAAALVVASAGMLGLRRRQRVLRYTLATGFAAALMWLAVGQSDVRPIYHTHVGRDLQKRGDLAGAARAFERARRHAPDDKAIQRYQRRLARHADRTEE